MYSVSRARPVYFGASGCAVSCVGGGGVSGVVGRVGSGDGGLVVASAVPSSASPSPIVVSSGLDIQVRNHCRAPNL